MKTITVSVDEDLFRRAEEAAAARESSVSALVRDFLQSLATGETRFERLKREEIELRERIVRFNGGDRLTRDDVHERKA